ncbi:hypothetical protein [Haliangium ochraceum]|uniref:Uncharacterized protein n=1 Tax=Haliangium ochraceum (strain DSM 14365 / JCM 11303 / SMP-2) TaxID=502025 RepID=D0LUP6_HALO1|nr:hypothetical protein [Haliangium ochraceum]ACY13936.1 hypothetical protein Hoch_1382 [Haliangium ochraceum DSM 14365]
MNVEFRPPAIGTLHVPIRITGPGTLELREDGLHVVGAAVAGRGRGLMIVLAVLAFAVCVALLQRVFDFSSGVSSGIAAGVGVAFLLPALRKPARTGEPVEYVFPWSSVRGVTYDRSVECLVVKIDKHKPKGGLFIVQPQNSPLQQQIEARLG